MSKLNAPSSPLSVTSSHRAGRAKPAIASDASHRGVSREATAAPVLAVAGPQQREALKALKVTAGRNRAEIFRDDFKGSANVKAEGVAYREAEVNGVKVDIISRGTLESTQRKVGQRLSLDETLTRAGYDVSKLTRIEKVKVLHTLDDKAAVQVGREAGKWLAGQAAKGREGQFSTRIQGVNGQTYLVTAKSSFDDAIRGHAQDDAWSEWSDRGVIPGKAEHRITGRDSDRQVITSWDKAERQVQLESLEKKREPIIEYLKFSALFGNGEARARTGVEGSKGLWDFDVELEQFDFAATRVNEQLFDGNTADFLGELVRASRSNHASTQRSPNPLFQTLREQLASKDWREVRGIAERVTKSLPAKATEAQLKAVLGALPPEERKVLRGAEKVFFDTELAKQQIQMIADVVQNDDTSAKRTFVFGDKKYELKLQAEFDVDVSRVKAPLFNRILMAAGITVGLVGGVVVGAALAAGAANAAAIAGVVAGAQGVIGGVNALSVGDFKGFALNLLSAAGSGMFGAGGFQQFASAAAQIAGGVDSVINGSNLFDKLSGVASLAGFKLDQAGAKQWAEAMSYVAKAANLSSAVVDKNMLGVFTAAMAVVNGELAKPHERPKGEIKLEGAMLDALRSVVHSVLVMPLDKAQARATLSNPAALKTAIKNGQLSVHHNGTWQKATEAKVAALETRFGSLEAALSSNQVEFGLQTVPDDVARALNSLGTPPKSTLFKPLTPGQTQALLAGAASGQLKLELKEGVKVRGLTAKELRGVTKDSEKLNKLLEDGQLQVKSGGKELSAEGLRNISHGASHLQERLAALGRRGRVSATPSDVTVGDISVRTFAVDLGIAPVDLQSELNRAYTEKSAADLEAYGRSTAQLREQAETDGYFGSEPHRAWAEAAEARTGRQIPSEWWLAFDPYGGTAGNGPNILPTGEYPGVLSRIAMAHDTDWSLGRFFGVGPLEVLHGLQGTPAMLGRIGLDPLLYRNNIFPNGVRDLYTNGHPQWQVRY